MRYNRSIVKLAIFSVLFLSSCEEEKLLLSNSQDLNSPNYLSVPNNIILSMEDEKTIKIEIIGNKEGPFSAQIARKISGSQDWIIVLNESEKADSVVYYDNYNLELNTIYHYQVRKTSGNFQSQAITDSINFHFLPPIINSVQQISDAKIELSLELPNQFINNSTINKILITRDSENEKKEFIIDGKSTSFIDSTFELNNIIYNYSVRSMSISGIVSKRSNNHEIPLSFSKLSSNQWTPLELNQMQIDFTFYQDQFDFLRSVSIDRTREPNSTIKVYEQSNPKNTLIKMTDNFTDAKLEEPIEYQIKWCGEVFCDSLVVQTKTLPFRYMKLIPGSETFILGPEYGNNNSANQTVKVDSFYADIYEVREAIYNSPGSEFMIQDSDLPISNVTWNEAVDFCNMHTDKHFGAQYVAYNNQKEVNLSAVGFRLPTEIEWEYMASYGENANTKRDFPWGNNISGHFANYYGSGDPYEPGKTPVGYYSGLENTLGEGQSFFGLQDLSGNVMEWCTDWYSNSAYEDHNYVESPAGPTSGEGRVVRGGGWQSDAIDCHNRLRKEFPPTISNNTIGFRMVISSDGFLEYWRNQ